MLDRGADRNVLYRRFYTEGIMAMQLEHFRFDIDENGIATILMDLAGERVNTLSPAASADLQKMLVRIEEDPSILGVVLGSAKRGSFVVGADVYVIKEITSASDATNLARDLQKIFARIEALHETHGKPVVAAIDGPALGGGLELALACGMRIVSDSDKTVLGLPEVKLGLIPGAGGTQRLPRLVGIANGLDMILTGKNIRPKKALGMGLADEVVPAPIVLQVAKARALAAVQGKLSLPKRGLARLKELAHEMMDVDHLQQLALEENPVGQRILFKKAREELLKKTRGHYPAPEKALEVVRIGVQEGLEAGYAAEADRFGQLVMTPEARALMSIFFATQDLKKDTGVDDPTVEAVPITMLGVLGGGLMGGGIAAVSVMQAGVPVRIKDMDDAGVARGMRYVHGLLATDVSRKRRRAAEASMLMHQVTGTTDFDGFKRAELVIEAVYEDLSIKQAVLAEMEKTGHARMIFASNTSTIPISRIAEEAVHPEHVIGMHYFSPVDKMPLLEVITTDQTAPWVVATCVAFGKQQGKTVIVVRDGPGFYTSRILAPYMNEAAWIMAEGVGVERIDDAIKDWGFPVGPITLLDEVGIDVAAKAGKVLHAAFGDRLMPPGALDALLIDDRKGRKNQKGFYLYENGKKCGVDTSVYGLLGLSSNNEEMSKEEIQSRISLQMINEAARCLQEGILRSPRDGDIGAIFGLGFPPFLGGPFAYVDRVGALEVVRRLETYADRFGTRFVPAGILVDYAKHNRTFYKNA